MKAISDKAMSLAYGVCDLRWREVDSPLYIESVPLCQSVSLTTCHLFQIITLKGMGQWNEFESKWLAGRASLGTAGLNEFSGSMGRTAGFCASIYMSSSHFFFLLPFFFRLLCCGKHTYRQERTKLITTSAAWTPLYLCAFYQLYFLPSGVCFPQLTFGLAHFFVLWPWFAAEYEVCHEVYSVTWRFVK